MPKGSTPHAPPLGDVGCPTRCTTPSCLYNACPLSLPASVPTNPLQLQQQTTQKSNPHLRSTASSWRRSTTSRAAQASSSTETPLSLPTNPAKSPSRGLVDVAQQLSHMTPETSRVCCRSLSFCLITSHSTHPSPPPLPSTKPARWRALAENAMCATPKCPSLLQHRTHLSKGTRAYAAHHTPHTRTQPLPRSTFVNRKKLNDPD